MEFVDIRFDAWIRHMEEERERNGTRPYTAAELEVLYRDVGDPVLVPKRWLREVGAAGEREVRG